MPADIMESYPSTGHEAATYTEHHNKPSREGEFATNAISLLQTLEQMQSMGHNDMILSPKYSEHTQCMVRAFGTQTMDASRVFFADARDLVLTKETGAAHGKDTSFIKQKNVFILRRLRNTEGAVDEKIGPVLHLQERSIVSFHNTLGMSVHEKSDEGVNAKFIELHERANLTGPTPLDGCIGLGFCFQYTTIATCAPEYKHLTPLERYTLYEATLRKWDEGQCNLQDVTDIFESNLKPSRVFVECKLRIN